MSATKTVERGWFGRLLGLAPVVYRCHGRDGVWRREHEGPLWYVGGIPGQAIPCFNCGRRVIKWPAEYGPTWDLDDG